MGEARPMPDRVPSMRRSNVQRAVPRSKTVKAMQLVTRNAADFRGVEAMVDVLAV
jgi:hypothetical protein